MLRPHVIVERQVKTTENVDGFSRAGKIDARYAED